MATRDFVVAAAFKAGLGLDRRSGWRLASPNAVLRQRHALPRPLSSRAGDCRRGGAGRARGGRRAAGRLPIRKSARARAARAARRRLLAEGRRLSALARRSERAALLRVVSEQ